MMGDNIKEEFNAELEELKNDMGVSVESLIRERRIMEEEVRSREERDIPGRNSATLLVSMSM